MRKTLKRTITLLLALVMVLAILPVSRADAASMKQGSKGTQVKQLQQNLIGLGYLSGSADGVFGAKTKEAVKKFQTAFGLSADGSAGEATQTAVRNAIVRLQAELKNTGFNPGTADGQFGSNTKKALQTFQKDRGLGKTGAADKSTWTVINSATAGMKVTAVRKGSSGTQVKQLQMALIGLGYLSGTADGQYGSKTTEAVRKYQSAYGLSVDGSAGSNTMTSLKNTVMTLQSDLARKGYYSGAIDGSFGSGTKNAVKAYQKAVGVAVTGVAGPKTMEKLYGYCLSDTQSGDGKTYKIWIDSLYQDGDSSKIWYVNGSRKSTTVAKSGCAGVATAMALNAMLDTNKYTGQNVMQWFADNGYYWGNGTKHEGIWKYPRVLGLNSAYCGKASAVVEHLKQGRVAVVLILDRTGEALFTYKGGGGHYVLVSGYRVENGVEQVFINNPLSYKSSKWFDLDDLMANVKTAREGYPNPFIVIYK